MKVLLTGATGRVGANMARRLLDEATEVRAMTLPNDPQFGKLSGLPRLNKVTADLRDQDSLDVACKGVTHVVHLAAQLMRGTTPVDRFYDVNALGTLRLLEASVRAGTVERFVLASSDGTYRPGDPPSVPLTEDVRQEPTDYYGTSKLLSEISFCNHAVQYDIPFSIVRFATVVSPEEAIGMFRLPFWHAFLDWQSLGKGSHLWPRFRDQPDLPQHFASATHDVSEDAAVGLTGPDGDAMDT